MPDDERRGAVANLPDEVVQRVRALRGRGWGPDRIYRELKGDLEPHGVTANILGNWIYKDPTGMGAVAADRLGRVADLLERSGISVEDIGTVKAIKLSEWQGITKNQEGEAETHDLSGASIVLTPTWEAGPEWQPVDRGPAVKIPKGSAVPVSSDGWETAVIIPDVQIGYRRDIETGELDPFHDEQAMAAALRVVRTVNPHLIVVVLPLNLRSKGVRRRTKHQSARRSVRREDGDPSGGAIFHGQVICRRIRCDRTGESTEHMELTVRRVSADTDVTTT